MKWMFVSAFVLFLLCLIFGPANVGMLLGRIGHNLGVGFIHFLQAAWAAAIAS